MSTTTPEAGPQAATLRIAVDIGGTFTDVAAFDEASGQLLLGKWSSTPRDLVEGILRAISAAGGDLADTVAQLQSTLTTARMQRLNARLARGVPAFRAAATHLRRSGLVR